MRMISDNHYLGILCDKKHDWEETGKSLRRKSDDACLTCRNIYARNSRAKNIPRQTISKVRYRAKKLNVPFNLDVAWYVENYSEICPVLGIQMGNYPGNIYQDKSVSVDRLIPALGYVRSNCRIISGRANRIKSDATLDELKALVRYLESEHTRQAKKHMVQ
jgi:hypothetical protein